MNIYIHSNDNEAFAAKVLSEELEKRCSLKFPVCTLSDDEAVECGIVFETDATICRESFKIVKNDKKAVISASDRLGLLYGLGRFITESDWGEGLFSWKEGKTADSPEKELRGMQLSYNSSANAYYNWTKETYEQYIRELIVFAGANAIEILAPIAVNDPDCIEIRTYPFMEMTVFLSETIHDYGAKVWMFYPNLINQFRKDFAPDTPEEEIRRVSIEKALSEREKYFPEIPYIDEVIMPSGDPGDLEVDEIFDFAEKMYEILKKSHPLAKIWPSCQNTKSPGTFKEQFYESVNKHPQWLGGVVYGPWTDHLLRECRKLTPDDIPVRGYPDICHSLCCQFPVHEWDTAFALTAGRECYNPRPREHKKIHESCKNYLIGNIPYTEGIADDVSKYIWLCLDWDSSKSSFEILCDFAHNFISSEYCGELASAISGIEDVSYGNASDVSKARSVYDSFRRLEKLLPDFGKNSYRFKMPYLMASYYYYICKRSVYEAEIEQDAFKVFDDTSLTADEKIEKIFSVYKKQDTSPDSELKNFILALAKELNSLIGWRLTVDEYKAKNYSRGAFIDTLDLPLNNRIAVEATLKKLSGMSEEEKTAGIDALRFRRFAGEGGKYISFGEKESMRYIEHADGRKTEPNTLTVPRIEHFTDVVSPDLFTKNRFDLTKCFKERVSSVLGYYRCHVKLSVDGLVHGSNYELRIVFPLRFGWFGQTDIPTKIMSGDTELKCVGTDENDSWIYIYTVPSDCIGKDGVLNLEIIPCEGTRGSGASEIWLIKK